MSFLSTSASFFDSESPQHPFEFIAPTPEHSKDLNTQPTCSGNIICTNPLTKQTFSACFGLFGSFLVRFKSSVKEKPTGLLDIVFARLRRLDDRIILAKNGVSFEFEFVSEETRERWVEALQPYCVMTNFYEKYLKLKMIGRGSFAQVFLVQSKASERFYAAKTFVKGNFTSNGSSPSISKLSLINEINLLRTLKHYNLIQLHGVYETENSLYIIMDLIQGKSLEDILQRPAFKEEFSDDQVMYLFHSILECTAYMSSKGIMHRDLKPTNILVEKQGRVKLIDLGLATLVDLPKYIFNRCGSPGYIAPEVFSYKEDISSSRYNDRCDVFSAGCILFYMMYGKPLFEGPSCSKIIASNRDMNNVRSHISQIQKEIKDKKSKMNKEGLSLLVQLLEPDHKKRIKAKEALGHAYFKPLKTKEIRLSSSKDMIFETLANYKWVEPKSPMKSALEPKSPNLIVKKNDFMLSHGSSDYSPVANPIQQDKYIMMDSMHLNIGRPEINGKLDTLGSMAGLQSPLLKNAQRIIANNSRSSFSIGTNRPAAPSTESFVSLQPAPGRRNIKPMTAQPDQTFLKAAIFKNMKKNEDIIEIVDDRNKDNETESMLIPSIQDRSDRRHTDYVITRNADPTDEEIKKALKKDEEDVDWGMGIDDEDCQVGVFVEKIKNLEILKPTAKMARF